MRTKQQKENLYNILKAWQALAPEIPDEMAKEKILSALEDVYKKMGTTAINNLTMAEGAKLLDLYADIQNVIIFLETGEDREFDVDFDIERIA